MYVALKLNRNTSWTTRNAAMDQAAPRPERTRTRRDRRRQSIPEPPRYSGMSTVTDPIAPVLPDRTTSFSLVAPGLRLNFLL